MTSRENVIRTIEMRYPERLAYQFSPEFGSDIVQMRYQPVKAIGQEQGFDEWGVGWESSEVARIGYVKDCPLSDWALLQSYRYPDITQPSCWMAVNAARSTYPDKYLIGMGISLYETAQHLRGMINLFEDMAFGEEKLFELLDKLVSMNAYAIDRYAESGFDGYMFTDDWGLQDKLMISPDLWHKLWKPYYAKIFKQVHDRGMKMFLHSCGYIVDILDGLIEAGLDVINMDQQANMGLERLAAYKGRITFFCPADVQKILTSGDIPMVRSYCRRMFECLGSTRGGFIARWYGDPVSAGHHPDAVKAMQEEFLKISEEYFGRQC